MGLLIKWFQSLNFFCLNDDETLPVINLKQTTENEMKSF
jgi:hypothetical protein